ncbi:hypothetical protein DHC50_02595 [Arenibacter sp. A80]|nr:hypothetical protein [Arenibacter sp. A80]RFT58064.1 hypothetical protein D0S24_02595 [Arenibacter sp. P308M17]
MEQYHFGSAAWKSEIIRDGIQGHHPIYYWILIASFLYNFVGDKCQGYKQAKHYRDKWIAIYKLYYCVHYFHIINLFQGI